MDAIDKLDELQTQLKLTGDWSDYGDIHFLIHGGKFIREDSVDGFDIVSISLDPEDESLVYIGECYVDITDDWIDFEAVRRHSGLDQSVTGERLAEAIHSYYGEHELNGSCKGYEIDQVKQELQSWGIVK